jgi:ATP-dependent helicase HrpB
LAEAVLPSTDFHCRVSVAIAIPQAEFEDIHAFHHHFKPKSPDNRRICRMTRELPQLPVSHVLPEIARALESARRAVLSAPPGAGKTTLVPLYLLDQAWRGDHKIILLEPRRLAARAAAARMASILGESVGDTVGYRMRLDNKVSVRTRIEVVTEGVFARMILGDPELPGIAAVIFDEFHERSLDADFGLALALDVQSALRPDLRLLVMSATLDVGRVAALLDHPPVIESLGRGFPIDIRYQDRPAGERIEDSVTRAVVTAHREESGSILAFLPGQAEITRTVERLAGRFGPDTMVTPLYGNLSQKEQDAAIRPTAGGLRKIVLATSIAETSITIDGIRIVIDSGLQRLPVFEAATGITRLETVRVSRASADQRAGRAGRTEPGIAVRLWHPGQTAALPAFTAPQILSSDLAGLVLDLAFWGVPDPATLAFLDQPPATTLSEARALLVLLGALDGQGGLTERGRLMRSLALPPRLAAMAISADAEGQGREACLLAVLLTEQGLGGTSVDLEERLRRFKTEKGERAEASRRLAERLSAALPGKLRDPQPILAGELLLHAFPDRIALQRGGRGRFVMANGRGAELPETERLAAAEMLVIADLSGRAAQPRILAAAEVSRSAVEAHLPGAVVREDQCVFDRSSRQVRARRVTRLGAIVFDESPLPRPTGEAATAALAVGVRELGFDVLPFTAAGLQLRDRIGFLHRTLGEPWPDVSDDALIARFDDWFVPFQSKARGIAEISASALVDGILALVPHDLQRELARLAPTHFEAPTGQRHPIRYDGSEPGLTIRVQELFGLKNHPAIGGGRLPLLLELTSPAHRPIQTTRDLPGFWTGSWKDVRADMRGRYPRHPWPEDPAAASPTTRVKPRGT